MKGLGQARSITLDTRQIWRHASTCAAKCPYVEWLSEVKIVAMASNVLVTTAVRQFELRLQTQLWKYHMSELERGRVGLHL